MKQDNLISPPPLQTFQGEWGPRQAKHLLSRTLFGTTKQDIDALSSKSMKDAVDDLLEPAPNPSPPVNDYNNDEITDPDVKWNETWINAPRSEINEVTSGRIVSLKTWWLKQMLTQNRSIHEKMILFWHNHFATQTWGVFYPTLAYQHFQLLRDHAFGNIKELTKLITIDGQMLIYLNGFANRKSSPDENYARELQELFCIGKGPDAGYTEDDVKAVARVLTGWSIDWEEGTMRYNTWAHDEEDKAFSSFYNNTVITGRSGEAGKEELDDLMDMLFDNIETARFLVRNIYQFFVYTDIDADTEMTIIRPLADLLYEGNYEVKPVLEQLLMSDHFYQEELIGSMIKSPIDNMVGFWRSMGVNYPEGASPRQKKLIRTSMHWNMSNMGMQLMDPPNVAGWSAYHQQPNFDKAWATTDSIPRRAILTDSFVYWGFWSQDLLTNVDLLGFIGSLDDPSDINQMIDEVLLITTSVEPTSEAKQILKNILLSGQLTDSYWTNAWLQYESDPTDAMKKNTVESRLKPFFQYLFQLSEYHLH